MKKIRDSDLRLHVGSDIIEPVNVVRDLGVLLDQELSMKQHVNKVASSCFFQLRRLKQVRRLLGSEVTTGLITAFITSRLDYCNACLAGLPKSTIAPLQRVQNAAARLVTGTRMHDHVTPRTSTASLASYKIPDHLQAVRSHASGAHWTQPSLSLHPGHSNIQPGVSSVPTFSLQPTLRDPANRVEIR